MKLQTTSDGRVLFWCVACDECHWFNTSWTLSGTDDKPTVNPSIAVSMPPTPYLCHSFIRDGQIEYLADCNHKLAGQTVDMVDIED